MAKQILLLENNYINLDHVSSAFLDEKGVIRVSYIANYFQNFCRKNYTDQDFLMPLSDSDYDKVLECFSLGKPK